MDHKPKIYIFASGHWEGDVIGIAMAEDGTVLGQHICSSWSWLRYDLHDRPSRQEQCQSHYPEGYEVIVLPEGKLPPPEVLTST